MEVKTILIVEDQFEFLAVNKLYLERHGYRVLAAEDGEEGVRVARQHQPDLILMDFSIPRLDGIGATAALKRDPSTREIPILLLTAHSYGSVARRALDAGVSGYIGKPVDPQRVLREVQQRIGSGDPVVN